MVKAELEDSEASGVVGADFAAPAIDADTALTRVLLLEDSPPDSYLVQAMLTRSVPVAYECATARTLEEGLALIDSWRPECLVVDPGLPDSRGLDTIAAVHAHAPHVAMIVLTGRGSDKLGEYAVALGAQDHLPKGDIGEAMLDRCIRHAIARQAMTTSLLEGRQRFEQVFDATIDPLCSLVASFGPRGEIDDFLFDGINAAGLRVIGRPAQEVIGQGLLGLFPGAREIGVFDRCVAVVETQQAARFEAPPFERDGVQLALDISIAPCGSGLVLSARDESTRLAAEAEVVRSERRLRGLIQNSTDIILVIDAEGILQYASPASHRVLGYDAATMVGTSVLDLVHPDDLAFAARALELAASTAGIDPGALYRVRHASGGWRWIESMGSNLIDDPAVGGIVINARDVTVQRQSSLALADLNRVLRTVIGATTTVVRARSEAQLLDDMCRVLVDTGGYALAWIARSDPARPDRAMPIARSGLRSDYFEQMLAAYDGGPVEGGPATVAIATMATQVIHDVADLPAGLPLREISLEHGYRSQLALPLVAGGLLVGALSLHATRAGAFDEEEVNLLELLAENLAYGIASLRVEAENERFNHRLAQNVEALVATLAAVSEARDPYTAGHQRRVATLAAAIATELGLDDGAIAGIRVAASLHDVGKIAIPAEILSKPGALTAPEFNMIKEHPQTGHDILCGIDFPWPVARMILEHHERIDGSGYPHGRVRSDLLEGSCIIAVADVVEAMASHRPYRAAKGVDTALAHITMERGTQLDAVAVDACLALFRDGRFSEAGWSTDDA